MTNNTNDPWKAREIGALWTRTGKTGTKFMSGKITLGQKTVNVVVYKNKFKKGDDPEDKSPNLRIYLSDDSQAKPVQAQAQKPVKKVVNAVAEADDLI